MRKLLRILPLMVLCAAAIAQSPYSNTIFVPGTVMTATAQTSAAIVLGQHQGTVWKAGSYAAGSITITGSSLTTATVGALGSSDGGITYYAIPISAVLTPGTTASTATVTAAGMYQVNLAGLTHIKFVTSGTFTATSITLLLTASPNAMISRVSSGAGGTCGSLGGDLSGTCTNAQVVASHITSGGAAFTAASSVTAAGTTPIWSIVPTASSGDTRPFTMLNANMAGGTKECFDMGHTTSSGARAVFCYLFNGDGFGSNSVQIGYEPGTPTLELFVNTRSGKIYGGLNAVSYATATDCASAAAPAVCGSAASGSVNIATSASSVVVNTTAVTAISEIHVTPDDSLGTKLGVTCNSTLAVALAGSGVIARTPGTSFTIGTLGTVTVNPACYSYTIIN